MGIQILRGRKHLFIGLHLPTVQQGLTSLVVHTVLCFFPSKCLNKARVGRWNCPRKALVNHPGDSDEDQIKTSNTGVKTLTPGVLSLIACFLFAKVWAQELSASPFQKVI